MSNYQAKKAAAVAYNAEYEVTTSEEDCYISLRVIEMLNDQHYEIVGALSHLHGANFDKRALGRGYTAIRNRVLRNLGLVSKYNAKGEARTPL